MGHKDLINSVSVSPNMAYIASSDDLGEIKIWDRIIPNISENFQQEICTLTEHKDSVIKVIFFPNDDNSLLSASKDNSIILWDIQTEKPIKILENVHEEGEDQGEMGISCMELSKSGNLIVSGGEIHGEIIFFSVEKWERICRINGYHEENVACIAISFDSMFVVSGGNDGRVNLYEFSFKSQSFFFKKILNNPNEEEEIYDVAFNEKYLVFCGKNSVLK